MSRPARSPGDRRPARLIRLEERAEKARAEAEADPTDLAAAEFAAAYTRAATRAAYEAAIDHATRNEARARTDATAARWAAEANGYAAAIARLDASA